MSRFVFIHIDNTVRLEVPDDHPIFNMDADPEDTIEAEANLITEAEAVLGDVYRPDDNDPSLADRRLAALDKVKFNEARVDTL